jgi:hypothetical protein
MDDCCRLGMIAAGSPNCSWAPNLPRIASDSRDCRNLQLETARGVTALYTVTDVKSGSVNVEVEQIQEKRVAAQ